MRDVYFYHHTVFHFGVLGHYFNLFLLSSVEPAFSTQCNSFNYRPHLRGRQLNSTGVFDKYALGRTAPAGLPAFSMRRWWWIQCHRHMDNIFLFGILNLGILQALRRRAALRRCVALRRRTTVLSIILIQCSLYLSWDQEGDDEYRVCRPILGAHLASSL